MAACLLLSAQKACRVTTITRETGRDKQMARISYKAQATSWGNRLLLQSTQRMAGLACSAHCWDSVSELAPLGLGTHHFFLASHLGPGHFHTEVGHSGLKTDLHSVRNRATLCSSWPLC
jgi:hypothetical protein